jgi:hypothetical protein
LFDDLKVADMAAEISAGVTLEDLSITEKAEKTEKAISTNGTHNEVKVASTA